MGVLSLRSPAARSPSPATGAEPQLTFLAWGAVRGRSQEIARALGGEAVSLYAPGSGRRPHVAWRYLHCTLATVWRLRRRPAFVIVTSPPVIAGAVALACGRLLGFPVALDSHPGAFGAQGDELSRRLQPLQRALVRRAAFTMVAAEAWADIVAAWGGRPVVTHEAPMLEPLPAAAPGERLRVLYVGRFAGDEPVAEVVRAAHLAPEVDILVTGDLDACPPDLAASAPANVTFVGFLDEERYLEALGSCHAVLALTTEPGSVMRAAYEAVYAGRPLVVSGWPIARELFACAVHVDNDAGSIAKGLAEVLDRHDELAAAAPRARRAQLERWNAQERALRGLIRRALDGSR